MKPIVVVGSINMDLVTRAARLPAAGETVLGESFSTFHGGKGANQAVAVARLGHPVHLLGAVGADSFDKELLKDLQHNGVDTGAVARVPGPSGVALIQVEPNGQNRITVIPGANSAVTPDLLDQHRHLIAGAAMVLTQLEIPLATVAALAHLCTLHAVPLMLDPAPAQALSPALLRQVTWLTPNLSEAQTLLSLPGPGSPEALARSLAHLGPGHIALKLGDRGVLALALAQAEAAPIHLPAFQVPVADTTAAGDCWNAAFAVALVRATPLPQALHFASVAAALSVTRPGAQPSLPTAEEVEQAASTLQPR